MLIIRVIAFVAVIFFGFTRLFYPGTEPGKQAVTNTSSSVANTDTSTGGASTNSNTATSTTDANKVDTTKLTEQQIKEWVTAVLEAEGSGEMLSSGQYTLNLYTGEDQLVHVSIDSKAQVDTGGVSQVPHATTSSTNAQESSAENADSSSQGDVSAEKSKVLGEESIEETPELASSSAATDNHTRAETAQNLINKYPELKK